MLGWRKNDVSDQKCYNDNGDASIMNCYKVLLYIKNFHQWRQTLDKKLIKVS